MKWNDALEHRIRCLDKFQLRIEGQLSGMPYKLKRNFHNIQLYTSTLKTRSTRVTQKNNLRVNLVNTQIMQNNNSRPSTKLEDIHYTYLFAQALCQSVRCLSLVTRIISSCLVLSARFLLSYSLSSLLVHKSYSSDLPWPTYI